MAYPSAIKNKKQINMKKVFIGLLLLAAAGAGYYLLVIKKTTDTAIAFNKNRLTGSWQIDKIVSGSKDSTAAWSAMGRTIDSSLARNTFHFDSTGLLIHRSIDTTPPGDTSRYEWVGTNKIYIHSHFNKGNSDSLLVERLVKDSLVLVTTDSARLYLLKMK